jgi:hypothetical protein
MAHTSSTLCKEKGQIMWKNPPQGLENPFPRISGSKYSKLFVRTGMAIFFLIMPIFFALFTG